MNKPALELHNLRKSFSKPNLFGKKFEVIPALDDLSLRLIKGEILGLVGESGSGKTTLGKSILKLLDVDDGTISILNKDVTHLSEKKFRPLRKNIQMIFQDLDAALNPNMTISTTLGEILNRYAKTLSIPPTTKQQKHEFIVQLLKKVQLNESILPRYPNELSGGQKRRIAIASALLVEPKIIVADEPTTGLDNHTQSRVMQLLIELQESEELSMIMISHDLQLIKNMCQKVAVMYLGNIIEVGNVNDVVNNPAHPYTSLLWESHLKHIKDIRTGDREHNIRSGLYDYERPIHGCRFAPRCKQYQENNKPEICRSKESKPTLRSISEQHEVACHFHLKS